MEKFIPMSVTININTKEEFERYMNYVNGEKDLTEIKERIEFIRTYLIDLSGLDIIHPQRFTDEKSQDLLKQFRMIGDHFKELYKLIENL
jgi:hypothetical protein